MSNVWQVQDAMARFSELLETSLAEGPQIIAERGVETAVLVPIEQWRRLERMAKPDLKELNLLAPEARTATLVPPRRKLHQRAAPNSVDAAAFREWAKLMHRRSDTLIRSLEHQRGAAVSSPCTPVEQTGKDRGTGKYPTPARGRPPSWYTTGQSPAWELEHYESMSEIHSRLVFVVPIGLQRDGHRGSLRVRSSRTGASGPARYGHGDLCPRTA